MILAPAIQAANMVVCAGKRADFTVLESDPYQVGARGLRDIAVWGTVFEGEVHPIATAD
jgi:predicted amidohydrolase YtcJ